MKKIERFKNPILVSQPSLPEFEKYTKYLEVIWEKKWLTNMGVLHEEFRDKLRKYLKVENAELFVNGHSALEIALRILELQGEVITTPFTFASTTHAIVNCGLIPIFCDIEPNTYNIDVTKIENLITKDTVAILAVHVFGNPCDVIAIEKIAKKYNLKVIYDAAHAFGVEIGGKGIGTFGDISMFSLHATKVFNAIEGGVLTFNDARYIKPLHAIRNFGITSYVDIEYIGINAKMNEFQAAMGLCNLEIVDSEIKIRKTLYKTYLEILEKNGEIELIRKQNNVKNNFSYFPILVRNYEVRENIIRELLIYNVHARRYFYPITNDFSCYNFDSSLTPVAKNTSERIITLPIHGGIVIEDIKKISRIITSFMNR